MSQVRYVSTRDQLKFAVEQKVENIVITDRKLAKSVRTVRMASRAAVSAAIVGTGAAVTNFWNPIGWAGAAVAVSGGTILLAAVAFLVVVLGVAILWALYQNYNIQGSGEVTLPGGTKVKGELVLSRA